MRTIQALETLYRGRFFRSRLEARWAVLFDLVGLPWEYELVGFDVHGVRYLPDFSLPSVPALLEVKPHNVPKAENDRLEALRVAMEDAGENMWILRGVPDADNHELWRQFPGGFCAGQFAACRKCEGVCWTTEDGWGEIGAHTCENNERWPIGGYETQFRKAQRWQFDHLEASNA